VFEATGTDDADKVMAELKKMNIACRLCSDMLTSALPSSLFRFATHKHELRALRNRRESAPEMVYFCLSRS
jgi:hypothetical protein